MKYRQILYAALFCIAAAVSAAKAAPLDEAREARLDKNFARAAAILKSAAAADPKQADVYLYLLGDTLARDNKCAEAVQVLDGMLKGNTKSRWYDKALFRKADCLLKMGRLKEADEIYEGESRRILGEDRKMRLANIYVSYGDKYFKPDTKGEEPDYEKARQFYQRALQMGVPDARMLPVRLRIGLCGYNMGDPGSALGVFNDIIESKDVPADIDRQAMYYLGLSQLSLGYDGEARNTFKKFIAKYPNDENAPDAAYSIGTTYGLPSPAGIKYLELGVKALNDYIEKYSSHEKAAEAAYVIAQSYYNMRRYEEAIAALERVVSLFGSRTDLDQVPQAKIMLGNCYFAQKKYDKAIAAWRKYQNEHPTHSGWSGAGSSIIDAEYQIAALAKTEKRYADAASGFEKFLDAHALDARAIDAMYELGDIEYVKENFKDAIKLWEKLVSKYPDSDQASRAQFQIADIQEKKFNDPEAAEEAFKKVTGSYSYQAQQRIADMKRKQLLVVTERTYTTTEKAVLKITARNIEKLQVRAYRIDVETYFKKFKTLRGVENLDIALIDPDTTFDYAVKNYKKMQRTEFNLEMPFKEEGVWAVTVGDDELESTTMLIVTNIAAIVKSSKNAVFVFAEDMRDGTPAKDARVLIGNDSGVFEAGKTGADGVLQYTGDKFKDDYQIQALVLKGGGAASEMLSNGDLSFVDNVKAKGLIYSERPAYRPGQTVKSKGIMRETSNGAYVFKAGDKYDVSLIAPGGVAVGEKKAVLSAFGTFAADFALSPDAPTGEYSIRAVKEGDAKVSFTSSLKVEEYKLERIKLEVTTPANVYFRGEQIKGKISAKYYFGQPVAGKKIEYRLTSDPVTRSGETNADGEIEFTVDTEKFEENTRVGIVASLTGENVGAAKSVWVAATEFDLTVSTVRDVYLAGESIEVTAKSRNLDGEPVKSSVRLEVLTVEGGAETRVQEMAMTESATGVSRATFKLSRGGSIVLRVFARDRFDNPVAAERTIFVSGDEDVNRLRIVTEKEDFYVGESPSVKVVYREKPALALVTYEGESVYRYKLVQLKQGENSLPLNILDEFAPNFVLAIAVMQGNKFHQTDKGFGALKGLTITLTPEKETYMPGEKMKLKVKTADKSGKPVKAELSLALVDEALYTLYKDGVPELGEFFFGASRTGKMKTISSNTFSYTGVIRTIARELIEQEKMMDAFPPAAPSEPMAMTGSGAGMPRPSAMPKKKAKGGRAQVQMQVKKEAADEESGEGYAEIDDGDYFLGGDMNAPVISQTESADKGAFKPGGPPQPRLRDYFPETGYWNPSVVTGSDGSAEVVVPLPDTATKWRITSRGVTVDTLVGEQTGQVVTKQDFFLSVKQPAALVEGSRAGFIVEAHNLTSVEKTAKITATFAVNGVEKQESGLLTLAANSTGQALYSFDVPAGHSAVLTVEATAADRADKVSVTVPVSPFGVEVSSVKSGVASENTAASIEFPNVGDISNPELEIAISPGLEGVVLDVDFPGAVSNNTTALEALSVLYRLEYLDKSGAEGADAAALTARLQGLVMRLVTNMNSNGFWVWTQNGTSNARADIDVTCNAVWALAMAKSRGVAFPDRALDKAGSYLLREFSNSKDDAEKARIIHSLSHMGKAEFAYINRLDRDRAKLPVDSLSYIALSYVNQQRPELAADVAGAIEKAADMIEDPPIIYYKDDFIPSGDSDAMRGLAMLAIEKSKPSSPSVAKLKAKLEESRRFGNWGTPEATMAAGAALAVYYSKTAHSTDKLTLSISVNGKVVKTVTADSRQAVAKIAVPADVFTTKGANKVSFDINGRGSFGYSIVASGFTKDVPKENERRPYISERKILPSPPVFNGREYQPGFGVTADSGKYWFENKTSEVPLGGYVTVNLSIYNYNRGEQYRGMMVVEDPLPAGATVDRDTVSGSFERYEIKDGKIIFYCSADCYSISYRLYGYLPGNYSMLPAMIYPSRAPRIVNYESVAKFVVSGADAKQPEEYKLTPDQLYYIGKDKFDAGMRAEGAAMISELLAKYELNDEPFREAHRMLMYVCIDKDDSKCIVEHFEQLKERYPSLSMEYKDVLRVGRAYHDIGENERAVQVYRTALESSFMTDGETRVFLEDQGRFLDSLSHLEDLTLEYPDLNVVQNAVYSNPQALYAKAAAGAETTPELKEKGYTREKLLGLAAEQFKRFMLLYPDSAYIDEAGFSLASAYFDAEKSAEVVELARELQKRYPKSALLDSFQYIEAYAHFEMGEYEKALALCKAIAEGKYYDTSGGLAESDNRNLALYITAQIYHTLNKPDMAADYYDKVAGQFNDAAGALAYFNVKTFSMPEMTSVQSGKPAAVKFTHRNIPDADIMVYRVDLMKFYLMRKSLKGMAQIQLSGIKPIYEKKLTFAKGREYRDVVTPVEIPAAKDGAYLVVLRSGNMFASGMLLRTNIEVEVQEGANGSVRVNVLDSHTSKYVSKAHVKVVGSGDGVIRGGSTDLRGIFTADRVSGTVTVLVKKGDQYAFHSGSEQLGAAQYNNIPAQSTTPAAVDYQMMRGQNTQNIMMDNKNIQNRNDDYIRNTFKKQDGVQMEMLQEQMMK